MPAIVVVQKLVTYWGKSGRGHPVASVRNNLPLALPLPHGVLAGPVGYHAVSFYQSLDFEPRVSREDATQTLPEHDLGLSLTRQGSGLSASFQWVQDCGAPRRNAGVPGHLFQLSTGQFGRVIHNGRFTPEYSWTYQQVVVNLGLFLDPTPTCFLDELPAALADLRANLW